MAANKTSGTNTEGGPIHGGPDTYVTAAAISVKSFEILRTVPAGCDNHVAEGSEAWSLRP